MPRQKEVLTTGEVAKVCNVAPRTVSKWFDSGALHGYRIPGSKDRRIPLGALLRFMKQHSIPMDGIRSGRTRVLIVDGDAEVAELLGRTLTEQANYEARAVEGGFAAGVECERFRPHAMLLDMHLNDMDPHEVRRHVRQNPDLQMTKVIATSGRLTEGQANQLLATGFDGYVKKPLSARRAIEAVEDAVAIVY